MHAILLGVYDEYDDSELAEKLKVSEGAIRNIRSNPFPRLLNLLAYADRLGYKFKIELTKKEDSDG